MAIQSFRCHDNFFHLCLDKGDIIEYGDFMARMFADKLDEILETTEKQNFNRRNTEDIYKEFVSSKDAA